MYLPIYRPMMMPPYQRLISMPPLTQPYKEVFRSLSHMGLGFFLVKGGELYSEANLGVQAAQNKCSIVCGIFQSLLQQEYVRICLIM